MWPGNSRGTGRDGQVAAGAKASSSLLALLALLALGGVLAAPLVRGPAKAEGPATSAPLNNAPDGRALKLTFQDEFQRVGPGPGPGWRTTFGDGKDPGVGQRSMPSNGELQLYVDRAYGDRVAVPGLDPFRLQDGVLHIRAEPAPAAQRGKLAGYKYTSGVVSTQPTFSQLYGYFEVRAKLPRGKGLWPALWLLPADLTWPPEIDIAESIGDPRRVYFTAHSKSIQPNSVPADLHDDGFHTYAVSWDPKTIVWYLDGREAARQPTPDDMHKPMYFLANLAVGGQWPGAPDASTAFPAELQLDFVRIYRMADRTP